MNHGRDSIYLNIDADKGLSKEKLKMVVAKRFSFVRIGHSMRATELEAAIGVAQFEGRHDNIRRRREIAEYYTNNLSDLSHHMQLPATPKDRDHNFMMYPIVLKNMHKMELVNFLEERNIETREMVPLTNQPIFKKIFGKDFESRFPVARWINESGFYIGSHPYLKPKELRYIVDVIHEFFARRKNLK